MRTRQGLVLTLAASVVALSGACTDHKDREGTPGPGNTAASAPSWEGKADEEDALRRATRALNAVEPDGASRVDEGMTNLTQGLDKTFAAPGNRPYSLGVACQAPTTRSVTLTLARGDVESEWEVTCGDREADWFNIPAGGRFTARAARAGQDTDGLVLWRLDTVPPDDAEGCKDDITGCEG